MSVALLSYLVLADCSPIKRSARSPSISQVSLQILKRDAFPSETIKAVWYMPLLVKFLLELQNSLKISQH